MVHNPSSDCPAAVRLANARSSNAPVANARRVWIAAASWMLVGAVAWPAAHASRPDPGSPAVAGGEAQPAVAPVAEPSAAASARAGALIEQLEAKAEAGDIAALTADGSAGPAGIIARLGALREDAVAPLRAFLEREHRSTVADRREVLAAIKADVPDKKGRFRVPGRKSKDKVRSEDEFDWLAELAAAGEGEAGGAARADDARADARAETIADVAAIRALAATRSPDGAAAILDVGFTEYGTIYRDECGRYLRRMAPYSLPALIVGQVDRKRESAQRRYASYQLDRLDRQDPFKVLSDAAGDEALTIAVIEAYGAGKQREAVRAVLPLVDHPSPRVRGAARAAWMGYVTGRAPPPAPKRKLKVPGGKLSKEEQPLWLNYRELAEVELRRELEELGSKPSSRAKPDAMTQELFAFYDARREKADNEAFARAEAAQAAGDIEAAVAIYDRILAESPEFPARLGKQQVVAEAFLLRARGKEKAEAWTEAAAAYGKAHGLAPDAPFADEALARHFFAVGKALEADGKDGSAAFRRASAENPEDREVATAAGAPGERSRWMLYAGVGGGASAVVLLIVGLAIRRRS